jgi:perosamine synthetase
MDIKVPLSRPDITDAEIQAVTDVLRSPYLSLGPKLREFEQAFEQYTGRSYAVAVNSGTSGLHLCLKAMGIGPGDEVITTPFTFIATVTSIIMTGARPVLVDIDPVSLNIDDKAVEAKITEKTKAILPVEVFGSPVGIDRVCRIAEQHNLPIIEDSCEGLGSELRGKKVGTFGRMSVFAFYPNKQMTTGEGGMILTDDEELAHLCISMRNQGRGRGGGWLAHTRLGYNYRLSDINCALGIVQLSRINEFIEKRQRVAQRYIDILKSDERIVVPNIPDDCRISWFVFVIRLTDRYTEAHRNRLLNMMLERGIQVSNYFPPVYLQPFIAEQYGYRQGDFPVTDFISSRTMALPFYNNLPEESIRFVCDELRHCLDQLD